MWSLGATKNWKSSLKCIQSKFTARNCTENAAYLQCNQCFELFEAMIIDYTGWVHRYIHPHALLHNNVFITCIVCCKSPFLNML